MSEWLLNFVDLFTESAPWLLMGLLIAGIMKYLIPISLLERHMSKNNLASVGKAAIIGAPLPLCSCGVIPAAIGLRRSGASPASTVSFLVATPETGVDSISISYALLGPFMAVVRPISAIISAIVAGAMVIFTGRPEMPKPVVEKACSSQKSTSCCAGKKEPESPQRATYKETMVGIWTFSTQTLLNDIAKWLLIGLVLAACVKTWVPSEFLTQWGDSFTAMLVMAVVGIPMYICASASTPIAAGFLAAGVSPGAVLVFMLAGPATNLATIGMVQQELGRRVMITYVITIIATSIVMGYATNWLVSAFDFEVYQVAAQDHEMAHSLFYQLTAVLLALLMVRNWVRQFSK